MSGHLKPLSCVLTRRSAFCWSGWLRRTSVSSAGHRGRSFLPSARRHRVRGSVWLWRRWRALCRLGSWVPPARGSRGASVFLFFLASPSLREESSEPGVFAWRNCCNVGERMLVGGWVLPGGLFGLEETAIKDCDAGYEDWQSGWSPAKTQWCCRKEGRGCMQFQCEGEAGHF